ncbi:MAG: hypothetical protein GY832_17230 [Chloroflexi bacterium]|nr:hypothetical protein [Chloroflexota bacterium]
MLQLTQTAMVHPSRTWSTHNLIRLRRLVNAKLFNVPLALLIAPTSGVMMLLYSSILDQQ